MGERIASILGAAVMIAVVVKYVLMSGHGEYHLLESGQRTASSDAQAAAQ